MGTTSNEAVKDLKKKSGQTPSNDDDGETGDGESSKDEDDLLEPMNGEHAVRAETKALIGGCIFIYSRSARRISFEISCHYR